MEVAHRDGSSGPSTFTDGQALPKLIIFDLDYTLWPFWVDTHVRPPLRAKDGNTKATDRSGNTFTFYPDIPSILYSAHACSVPLAIASRTCAPSLAVKLLKLLHVPTPAAASPAMTLPPGTSDATPLKALDFFRYQEIFPGDKRTHMRNLKTSSGVSYQDMLFFDDESRNRNVESLGVCFWLVEDGVSNQEVDKGVREWRKRRWPSSG